MGTFSYTVVPHPAYANMGHSNQSSLDSIFEISLFDDLIMPFPDLDKDGPGGIMIAIFAIILMGIIGIIYGNV